MQISTVISSSELDHVTGGIAKEPSPSGTPYIGGGAGGRAISKDEKAKLERYCYGGEASDPFGIGARERQKTCDKLLGR